jgi:lysozyme family protein
MTVFEQAFAIVVGHEGGYDVTSGDPGNWTGGAVGKGELHGTKYGISAAAYPTLDIANLTVEQAQSIYARDYWSRVAGDSLPPPLALLLFDSAVNNGVDRAIRWLQGAVGVGEDGQIGPATLTAVNAAKGADVCSEFMAHRLAFMAALPTWRLFGLGWARRLCALPYESLTMTRAA